MQNLQTCLVSLPVLCAANTLHCLAGYFFFPSPPPTIFSSLCILKSAERLPGSSCLDPLSVFASLAIEGHQNLTHFDSGILISRTFLHRAESFCTLLFCLYLVSCTQKKQWRVQSIADTVPPFLTILQYSSELSNDWGTGLPCLALHEFIVLDKSIWLLYFHICFPSFCPVFTIVASCIVLIIRTSLLPFHTCTIKSPFLWNAYCPFFKSLPSRSRSSGMHLLAFIVLQTLTFLSSNVWANLTLL